MSAQDYTLVIKEVLTDNPFTRDDDISLFRAVVRRLNFAPEMSLDSYLTYMRLGKLPAMESVCRLRRMIQTEHPELRGAKYAERHQREKDVQSDLGYEHKTTYFETELFERNEK